MNEYVERLKNINKNAYEYLNSKNFSAGDFNGKTTIYHSDGSVLSFCCSIFEEKDDKVYLWSEHNGYHFWHISNLEKITYESPYQTSQGRVWSEMADFMEANKVTCEGDMAKLCPPTGSEDDGYAYTLNQFLIECYNIVEHDKNKNG